MLRIALGAAIGFVGLWLLSAHPVIGTIVCLAGLAVLRGWYGPAWLDSESSQHDSARDCDDTEVHADSDSCDAADLDAD